MTDQTTHTAILLFSRSSKQEALSKSFLPSRLRSRNREVAQKLIDRSVRQVKATGLPFFIWNEHMQHGGTFGEKLTDAVDSVFQKGFKKVVIIGNDCISLTSRQIQNAALSLDCHDAVLAPTKKGGAYLIGLSKNTFDRKSFISIRWQTTSTCDDLLTLMDGQQICTLPAQNDVNNYADLLQQLNLLVKNNPVRLFIENILASSQNILFNSFCFLYHRQPQYSFGTKAPPSFFA